MDLVLLALAIPICIADVSTFVIPNIYSKILFYVALVYLSFHGLGQLSGIAIGFTILVVLLIAGLGMGDIKILALIILTHSFTSPEFISYVFLIAIVHIVILAGIHRKLPSKIPLAPSIFIGLATYLAAR